MTTASDTAAARAALAPHGTLHAAINIGNPVLASGPADRPTGVTVDIAREIAARLDATAELHVAVAAKDSLASLVSGESSLAFLANEPARAEQAAFTDPYVLIEGAFVVPEGSPVTTVAEVDRAGVTIGVKSGSAYDLYLSRTLEHAELVRGDEGVEVYLAEGLDVGAGIRQPVEAFAAQHAGQRVIPGAFMQIRQAIAIPNSTPSDVVEWIDAVLDELKVSGFIARSLAESGHADVTIAPPRQGN